MSKQIARELLKMAEDLKRESGLKYDTIGKVVKEMQVMIRNITSVYYRLVDEEEGDDYLIKFNKLYAKALDALEEAQDQLTALAKREQ